MFIILKVKIIFDEKTTTLIYSKKFSSVKEPYMTWRQTAWSGSYITPSTCRKLVSISTSKAIDTIEYWFSVVTIQFYNPPTALTSL
jgi:hypothetical protein